MLQLSTCWINPALPLAPHCSPFLWVYFLSAAYFWYVCGPGCAATARVILASARFTLFTLALRSWNVSLVSRHLFTGQSSVLREALNFCSILAPRAAANITSMCWMFSRDAPSRVPQPDTPGGNFAGSLGFTSRKHLGKGFMESACGGEANFRRCRDEPSIALDGLCRFTRGGQRSLAAFG